MSTPGSSPVSGPIDQGDLRGQTRSREGTSDDEEHQRDTSEDRKFGRQHRDRTERPTRLRALAHPYRRREREDLSVLVLPVLGGIYRRTTVDGLGLGQVGLNRLREHSTGGSVPTRSVGHEGVRCATGLPPSRRLFPVGRFPGTSPVHHAVGDSSFLSLQT